jgi:hypothetical protein
LWNQTEFPARLHHLALGKEGGCGGGVGNVGTPVLTDRIFS